MPARGPPLWEMPGSEPAKGDPRAQPQPRNPSQTTSSISALRGGATYDKTRRSGTTCACGHPSGKLPPPRWPQAQTMGMLRRGFSGLSGVFGAKSTIDPDGYGRIAPTMALKFLSFVDALQMAFAFGSGQVGQAYHDLGFRSDES